MHSLGFLAALILAQFMAGFLASWIFGRISSLSEIFY